MNETTKERRCKSCGKLLFDAKWPRCKRCFLEGRNKIGQIGGIFTVLATPIAFFAKALTNDNSNKNDSA